MDHLEMVRLRQVGEAAREMLSSDAFAHFMNAVADENLEKMVATPLGSAGQEKRDRHHAILHALNDIKETAEAAARLLDDLETSMAEQRANDEDE